MYDCIIKPQVRHEGGAFKGLPCMQKIFTNTPEAYIQNVHVQK